MYLREYLIIYHILIYHHLYIIILIRCFRLDTSILVTNTGYVTRSGEIPSDAVDQACSTTSLSLFLYIVYKRLVTSRLTGIELNFFPAASKSRYIVPTLKYVLRDVLLNAFPRASAKSSSDGLFFVVLILSSFLNCLKRPFPTKYEITMAVRQ